MNMHFSMKKTVRLLLIALAASFLAVSCTSENTQTVDAPKVNEDFGQFYKRFLADDDFQKDRIIFPLKGRYMENEIAGLTADTTDQVLWTKANWKPIHKKDDDSMTDVKVTKSITDTVAVIKTEGVSFNFLFEETYTKKDGLWYLTNLIDIAM